MAKLTDLLNQIQTNPKFVKLVDPNQDFGFYKFYTIYYKENDIIKSTSVCIYIDNRDTPTESAYFKDFAPVILTTPPVNQILVDAKAKIAEIIAADATIEKVTITNSNQDVVECTAYKYDAAAKTVSKINVVMYYDSAGNLIWRKLA